MHEHVDWLSFDQEEKIQQEVDVRGVMESRYADEDKHAVIDPLDHDTQDKCSLS